MITALPIYVQKYFIKIICNHINYNFKLVDTDDCRIDYDQSQKETKQFTLNLVLVSKLWFKTVSSNLNVSIDFNYNLINVDNSNSNDINIYKPISTEYSIIKFENVKSLKLHFNHENDTFHKYSNKNNDGHYESEYVIEEEGKEDNKVENNENEEDEEEVVEVNEENQINPWLVKDKLRELSVFNGDDQFKKVIIKNSGLEEGYSIENLENILFKCKATSNIQLLEYHVDSNSTIDTIIKHNETIKKVYTLVLNRCFDKSIIQQSFKQWYKNIIQFYVFSQHPFLNNESQNFQLFKSILNCMKKEYEQQQQQQQEGEQQEEEAGSYVFNLPNLLYLNLYEFSGNELKDLNLILTNKATPKLQFLSMYICFDNLNYYLSTPEERIKHSIIGPCSCNNLYIPSTTSDDDENQINFKKHWNQFKELIKNKSDLRQFELTHECTVDNNGYEKWFNKIPPSKSFTNELIQLYNSIPKLERILLSTLNAHNIVLEILKNSKNQSINKIIISLLQDIFSYDPFDNLINYNIDNDINNVQITTNNGEGGDNYQEDYKIDVKDCKSIFGSIFNENKNIKNLKMEYVQFKSNTIKQSKLFNFKRK